MKTQLLATFTTKTDLETTIEKIRGAYTIAFGKVYVLQNEDNISEFDSSVSKEELDYWWKTTGKIHEPLANRFWTVNKNATYIPEDYKMLNHRRVLIYKLIPGKEKDFWRYRTRLAKALKESGWKN